MADTPEVQAYYAKEQVRVLKWKLELFREVLRSNTNPKRTLWLEARISELDTVLFERTGTRY
jgi:hypothetical protein